MTKKLLVVDDEPSITRIIGRIAEGLGYEVVAVNKPDEALDTYSRFQPSILMIDMIMPDIDGIDILRHVAATGVQTKIVVMSGFGAGYLRLAKAVAAFEEQPEIIELAKPFRRSDIIALLAEPLQEPVPPVVFSHTGLSQIEPVVVAA